MASQAKQSQKDFIERVRRTFLVGDDVPEHLHEGALNLQTQLNNALRLLSEDLYSKKSHFVLELVQNADDNAYAKGVVPELTLDVSTKRLVLTNNELGFTKENIGAICKVGASSKAKDKQHHIGEKGIGFKSVFSVSDAPEIHSNGYHFCFDRTDPRNLLGYVIPTWCDVPLEARAGSTTIILPASPDYEFDASTLADLDARVLLFLNKLRQLTLTQDGSTCSYKRSDHKGISHLMTAVTGTDGTVSEGHQRYVRVMKTFDMTGAFADEKRPDVGTSSVVLAFPVESSGEARLEPASYVFAYLPIHQMGFKFPLHADFILNSGREAVLNDRAWNKGLRNSIATTFVAAVEQFKKNEALGLSYLNFLPDAAEVSDAFFGTVRQQIVEGLSAVASLPSASGEWRRPSELRIAGAGFTALFPSPLALELFGFDYVDDRVQGSPKLLEELGVTDAGYGLVLDVFRTHQEWLVKQPLEWRASLYAYIAGNIPSFLNAGLLAAPCLPTADGKYVAPDSAHVFFPLGGGKKYGFEHELVIVDGELYSAALEQSSDVKELFEDLEVLPDDPYDMVVSHILPRHEDDAWKASSFKALVGHLGYVKDHLEPYLTASEARGQSRALALQKVQLGLWVWTKGVNETGNWMFRRAATLYLGKEYKPDFCIETLLAGEPGPIAYVSAKYLDKKPKDAEADVTAWREFFDRLGVRRSPAVELKNIDWHCSKELRLLLGADSTATRQQTLECMSRHWQNYSSKLSYQLGTKRHDTTFAQELRATEAPLIGRKGTAPLSSTYYQTQELKAILGEAPPYVDAFLDASMRDACRITHRLDAPALIKRLKQLKQENGGTVRQVQIIYRELEKLWDTDEALIKDAFEDHGLVQMKGAVRGWFSPSQVSWRSNGKFLDALYPPLPGPFRDFQGFFIDKLGVPRELPLAKRVQALTELTRISEQGEREDEALAIYKQAEKVLRLNADRYDYRPVWMDIFEENAVYVDHHGALAEAGDSLFANDAPEYAKLFMEEEELSFLAVPTIEIPRLSHLLRATDIALLSESVEVEVEDSVGGSTNRALTERVQRLVPYIARILYAKQQTYFDDALKEHRFAWLWRMEIIEVPELKLRVSLNDFEATMDADCALQGGDIRYRSKATSLKDRVAAELSKFFIGTAELRDIFVRLLMEDEGDIEEVLRLRSIGPLPADVAAQVMQRELPEEQDHGDPAAESEQPALTTVEADAPDEDDIEEPATSDAPGPVAPPPPDEAPAQSSAPQPSASPAAPTPSAPAAAPTTPAMPSTPRPPAPPNASAGASNDPVPSQGPADKPAPPAPVGPPVWRTNPGAAPTLHPVPTSPASTTPPPFPGASAPDPRPSGAPGGFRQPWSSTSPSSPGEQGTPPSPHILGGVRRQGSTRSLRGRKEQRGRTGRLLSYVEGPYDPCRPPTAGAQDQAGVRDAVGKAAVVYAMAMLAKRWASLTEMPHNNPGYDVRALTAAGEEEFIEVKGQGGAWTHEGVALTPAELLTAQRMGDRYWLCVVEFAEDEKRRQLSLVKNPFGLAQQFRYDVGWRAAAEKISGAPSIPEKGLYVDITGVGPGRIISVRVKGKFSNIHVILQGGKQTNCVFNPAKMTLSEEPLWPE
jgi:hypothetical protein